MGEGEGLGYLVSDVHPGLAALVHCVRPPHLATALNVVPQDHLQTKGNGQLAQDVVSGPARHTCEQR